ncbi:putative sulfate exporter family transporter [Periweissella cryptocerci]|uniref:Putative sulfate exporter family transporter n=1 Tax=Periweissella cryptocerci TaxID=2506420 RepID=A0A4P6YTZ5_9LACO|nr:putative sulfate exporter family transporter [Periweissella cryptocerci]QBO36163.1 putative sulfate exporter family transporter [Periweissella cryptocerci]
MQKKYGILPGLALSFGVAIIAQFLSKFIPHLGAATIAIFLGIILGNTVIKQLLWKVGTGFAEKKLLEGSVVLLGATVTFQTIAELRLQGVVLIIIQMAATIAFVYWLGKRLLFNRETALLMSTGNAICGSSAIASVAPVIKAKDDDRRTAIMMVNLMGTVLMMILPIIGPLVFGHNNLLIGGLIGATVQSVGQVIASGLMVNHMVATYATLFKIMRIILLIVVVLLFSKMQKNYDAKQGVVTETKAKIGVPWYVLGFFILCILNSSLHFPTIISGTAHTISSWFEVTALAAIGLNLNLVAFIKSGKNLAIYGAVVMVFQVALAIILLKTLF